MGFVPKPRTREVICDWIEPEEGSEPLTATLICNLTLDQIDHVNAMFRRDTTYIEIFELISPYVIAWNAQAIDSTNGDWAPVPPPAEIGPDALRAVDPIIGTWLLWSLGQSYRGGPEREEKSKPSGDTPKPDGGENSTSRRQIGSTKTRNKSAHLTA